MNPWLVKGLAVLGAALVLLGAGWKLGVDHVEAREARDKELIQQAATAFDESVAKHVGAIRVKHTTIQNEAKETIRESTFYRECVNDPAVERLLDDARANRDPRERETGVPP